MERVSHPHDLHRAIVAVIDRGQPFAVATVLQVDGSTPCKAGAKALIDAQAAVIQGTIGGGLVEAQTQRLAAETIRAGRPAVMSFLLQGDGEGATPICGGAMRVLIDPAAASHRAAYEAAAMAAERRARGVLLTSIRGTEEIEIAVRFVEEPAVPMESGFPGGEALRAALAREEAVLLFPETSQAAVPLDVLVEPVVPRPLLVICGGGHVGQAVAAQAVLVGFEILVIDDRPEFAEPGRFPEGTATRCGRIDEEIAALPIGADTYLVIVTRGHRHDAEALAACIRRPAAYLGMIGSRRKVAALRQEFLASGRVTEEEFGRVHAPIGLNIGAVTVPEIASSIVAQLIAVRRGVHA